MLLWQIGSISAKFKPRPPPAADWAYKLWKIGQIAFLRQKSRKLSG